LRIGLNKILKKFLEQGKKSFYLSEFVTEANVTVREAEDFFLPLLKRGKLEGKLELRCPCCGKDVEMYDRMSQIPEEIECEICGCKFSKTAEYVEIILEVKGKFFRDQECSSCFDRKDSDKRRIISVIEGSSERKEQSRKRLEI
jgi:predicted nucleic acid-binding Zn ribbon protein